MFRFGRPSWLGALAAGSLLIIQLSWAGEAPRNIVLIGWDGAQREHVRECLSCGELPNLQALSAEGTLVAIDILRTTDTKAGWTQILTGYEPEVTGVFNNRLFEPIPEGYTVFERLENHFGSDRFVTLAVIGKKGNLGTRRPICRPLKRKTEQKKDKKFRHRKGERIIIQDGKKFRFIPGEPYHLTRKSMDVFENGLLKDNAIGTRALELIERYADRPFFAFVHFAEIDHQGHRHGENSKEYNDALISADYWTGKIIEKLRELRLYDQTLVYVTADHGFDEGMRRHRDAPYIFLGTNDSMIIRRGERADIAATILDRFGLDLSVISPPLDGQPLTRPLVRSIW